ncbi:MAG: hypothetical protein JWO62_501, partial [Acidimicrobiaceae bacterium]|nr:hypothetical protein [Acidimicrobiaceae bacterium]
TLERAITSSADRCSAVMGRGEASTKGMVSR